VWVWVWEGGEGVDAHAHLIGANQGGAVGLCVAHAARVHDFRLLHRTQVVVLRAHPLLSPSQRLCAGRIALGILA
jgi:hypothetical protein